MVKSKMETDWHFIAPFIQVFIQCITTRHPQAAQNHHLTYRRVFGQLDNDAYV